MYALREVAFRRRAPRKSVTPHAKTPHTLPTLGGWNAVQNAAVDAYYNNAWQTLEIRKDGLETSDAYKQYVWSQRFIDAPVLRDRDTTGNGTLNERLYYATDANMNVTALIDTAGAVQERASYDPYGKTYIWDANWNTRASSSYDNGHLYAGYRHDTESGLYHVRFRAYHPTLGRWVQRDPRGYVDGMSLYEYVMSNPLRYSDPMGVEAKGSRPFTVDWYTKQIEGLRREISQIKETRVSALEEWCCTEAEILGSMEFWQGQADKALERQREILAMYGIDPTGAEPWRYFAPITIGQRVSPARPTKSEQLSVELSLSLNNADYHSAMETVRSIQTRYDTCAAAARAITEDMDKLIKQKQDRLQFLRLQLARERVAQNPERWFGVKLGTVVGFNTRWLLWPVVRPFIR
jgi:RHS repeat-associated protein